MTTIAIAKGVGSFFQRYAGSREDMAFRDFTFSQVQQEFGLAAHDADLFASVPPFPVAEQIASLIQYGAALAAANGTEKAKSEFVIAPVLVTLRQALGDKFLLFSGLQWEVDADRGLNGYCDFILTKGKSQYVLGAPFVAIVEGKNDLVHPGLGQCIAAMVAAQLSNQQAKAPIETCYGVVTTGSAWKFLRLQGTALTIDIPEYYIDNLPKIMGILKAIVESV